MNHQQASIHNPQSPDGVLIIDKPIGLTSHDVVARVRKILKTRRVGHSGTLDPFATGVLAVCVNRATRLVQFLTGDEKEYLATMQLGWATDTGDLTGSPILPVSDASRITAEELAQVLSQFKGHLLQTPPMYSAKKVGGVKLYEMARRGEVIERQPVKVEIKELELVAGTGSEGSMSGEVQFTFRVVCSAGTYVRTLAEDIGRKLGVGAHLVALRRTRAGNCALDRALMLEQLAELVASGKTSEAMITMASAIDGAELILTTAELQAISHGRTILRSGEWPEEEKIKLCDDSRNLMAIGFYDANKRVIRPKVVLTPES